MFADSDLTALVYDRRLAPVVTAAALAAPGLRGLVEIDDGSPVDDGSPPATARAAVPTTGYDEALAAASPKRDFPARSGDDVYIIYTGGTRTSSSRRCSSSGCRRCPTARRPPTASSAGCTRWRASTSRWRWLIPRG